MPTYYIRLCHIQSRRQIYIPSARPYFKQLCFLFFIHFKENKSLLFFRKDKIWNTLARCCLRGRYIAIGNKNPSFSPFNACLRPFLVSRPRFSLRWWIRLLYSLHRAYCRVSQGVGFRVSHFYRVSQGVGCREVRKIPRAPKLRRQYHSIVSHAYCSASSVAAFNQAPNIRFVRKKGWQIN